MSKKDKKKKKKTKDLYLVRKRRAGCEHQSDKRTADFAANQLDSIQEQLGDLMPELRIFERYGDMMYLSFNLALIERLKKKLRKFADQGVWDSCDD